MAPSRRTWGFIAFSFIAAVVLAAAITFPKWSKSAPGAPSISARFGAESDFATAGANALKPALADMAKRINEGREATKAIKQDTESLKTRVKAIEESPAFDFKKYEKELRENILKDLPASVPMSQYRALEKKVLDLAEEAQKKNENFPLCSAA